jgi:hypothetical protein
MNASPSQNAILSVPRLNLAASCPSRRGAGGERGGRTPCVGPDDTDVQRFLAALADYPDGTLGPRELCAPA